MGASLDAKRLPSEQNQAILNHLLDIAPTTDLRGLLKFVRRMVTNAEGLNSVTYRHIVELHAKILLGVMDSAACDIRFSSAVHTWIFSFKTASFVRSVRSEASASWCR